MGKSCKDIAQQLYDCVKDKPCVVEQGGNVRECIKTTEECKELRNAYFTCKRSGIDMRTRIRGERVY